MKVLLIEDEPDLLNGLAHALRQAGYVVDIATDGEEGFYEVSQQCAPSHVERCGIATQTSRTPVRIC